MDIKSEVLVKDEFLLSTDDNSNDEQDLQLEENQESERFLNNIESKIEVKDETLDIEEEMQNDHQFEQIFILDESQIKRQLKADTFL
ncbi:hypothetical protein Avbf_09886 [Armadillidium vulgare]|nr:hypothetical protein Avbf_09886 [Armadillidium vulgare]